MKWFKNLSYSLTYGFTLPFQALKLVLKNPTLLGFCIIPLLITASLYIYFIPDLQVLLKSTLLDLINSLGWDPSGWLAATFLFVGKILLFLVSAVTFSLFAGVIATPFNDILAEKTERLASPALSEIKPPKGAWFRFQARIVYIDFVKTLAAMFLSLVALFMGWVPGLNIVSMLLVFFLLTFQYVTYPQTRREITMSQAIRFLWQHKFVCLSFGAITSFGYSIPFFSVVMLPLSVISGTLLYAKTANNAPDEPHLI